MLIFISWKMFGYHSMYGTSVTVWQPPVCGIVTGLPGESAEGAWQRGSGVAQNSLSGGSQVSIGKLWSGASECLLHKIVRCFHQRQLDANLMCLLGGVSNVLQVLLAQYQGLGLEECGVHPPFDSPPSCLSCEYDYCQLFQGAF